MDSLQPGKDNINETHCPRHMPGIFESIKKEAERPAQWAGRRCGLVPLLIMASLPRVIYTRNLSDRRRGI